MGNAGFTSMEISSNVGVISFNRVDAQYSTLSGIVDQWIWPTTAIGLPSYTLTDPFPGGSFGNFQTIIATNNSITWTL